MLIRNDWNVAKSAQDTHLPEQTVRDWARRWKVNGPEEDMLQDLQDGADVFIEDAERIRNLCLKRLEEIVPEAKSVRELTVAIGILDDKVASHRGLRDLRPVPLTGQKGPQELQAAIGEMFVDAIAAATARRQTIEAEAVEISPPEGLPVSGEE
jgi:hypothetical protein